jgi:hypothetical protein
LTPGPVDDRQPVNKLGRNLGGKLFGERGNLSPERLEPLWAEGLPLIPQLQRNRKNHWRPTVDKRLWRKRARMECGHDPWTNISPIEHRRHRRSTHAIVHLLAAVLADPFQPQKPTWDLLTPQDRPEPLL